MLSSKASPSNALSTYIPPGTTKHEFNVTVVVLVSDILGSTTVTSRGKDGMPVTILSTSPDEVLRAPPYVCIVARSEELGLTVGSFPMLPHNRCVGTVVVSAPPCDSLSRLTRYPKGHDPDPVSLDEGRTRPI